ncbi:AAA family ATPase [Actinomadura sp. SCN-SB]|uniref:helix-turn-helix transcriptional regulator n=1 Tax=Actinomadura sp. SCN-SB TaxID=3373092 RepID=UPI0037518EC8
MGSVSPSAREHIPGATPTGLLDTTPHDTNRHDPLRHDTTRHDTAPHDRPTVAAAGTALDGGGPARPLRGRDRELARLDGLLGRARDGHGGALTVIGGPGTGKSALLGTAVRKAGTSFLVLRARGVRQESAVPYAGLHRVLRPIADLMERFPSVRQGGVPPLALYAEVCSLLAESAAERPVLCWIDDAHRLDRVSLEALAFAARRLADVPVAVLFAARPGPPGSAVAECLDDIPRLALEPLDEAASVRVLQDLTCGALDEEAASEVAEPSGGNPLALAELAGALTPEQLSGTAPPPRSLPQGSALRAHYRRRYLRLTTGARRLVLLAAADDRLELTTLSRAAALDGIDPRELEWARASGLVEIDGGRVDMPSALVRSCLYADASPAERRAVHDLLARALEGEWHAPRRSWHRAAPADEPDDALADDLACAAETSRSTGMHADASRLWERAASLSTRPEVRAERYLAAAHEAWAAGRGRRARVLLRRVRPLTSDTSPALAGRTDLLHGDIEFCDGLPVMAQWILREAAERLAEASPADPAPALDALLRASAAADATGDHHYYGAIVTQALTLTTRPLPDGATPSPVVELIHDYFAGMAAAGVNRRGEAVRRLRRVLKLVETIDSAGLHRTDLRTWACAAAVVIGDDRRARDLAARAVAAARNDGGAVGLPRAMTLLAHCEMYLGRYPAAESTAREGLRLSMAAGQRNQLIEQRAVLALLAAFRGDRATALSCLDGLAEEGGRRELIRATSFEPWALACLDLADDRAEDAAARLRQPAGSGSGHPVLRLLAIPHLVEACVRMGEREPARRAFAAFERWAGYGRGPARAALAERCRALLATDEETAHHHYEEALRLHEDGDSAFELARTALLYGHRLRRDRRPRDARPHLRNAAQIFQQAGAEPWAARARAELRAAGETLNGPAPAGGGAGRGPLDALTAQQLQIARLVAAGATNREIAARLVISPRTVDGHLRNIFTRLGLRSRIELARLLR